MWVSYKNGKTIYSCGTENGTIIQDEEYQNSCRITLEIDGATASFCITCGVYGMYVHTVFASSEREAIDKYSLMKHELQNFIDKPKTDESAWCEWFKNKF